MIFLLWLFFHLILPTGRIDYLSMTRPILLFPCPAGFLQTFKLLHGLTKFTVKGCLIPQNLVHRLQLERQPGPEGFLFLTEYANRAKRRYGNSLGPKLLPGPNGLIMITDSS